MVRWLLALVAACGFHPSTTSDNDSAPADTSTSTAADAPHDAMVPSSIVIEAESYTTKHDSPTEAWNPATAIQSFSGASYMQCGPDSGAYCPNDANLPTCAASMTYDLTIATAATYYAHVRTYGASSSSDSLWYGVDGTPAADVVDFIDNGAWNWQTGATTYTLAAGAHTLTIYQRECGAAVDVVAVTTSNTNPP
jgi:hypothetical protein